MDAALPYELRALEAALSAAARLLDHETSSLEARSLPALNSLTQKARSQPKIPVMSLSWKLLLQECAFLQMIN